MQQHSYQSFQQQPLRSVEWKAFNQQQQTLLQQQPPLQPPPLHPQTVQQQPVYQQQALWVEYLDDEGRLYYWNTQTQWAQYDAPVLQPQLQQLQQQVGGGGGYGKAPGQGAGQRFAPY
jgi:hypothetical protein